MKTELKDKLNEIMDTIGEMTNYQDIGARKYAARGIMLYIIKEISIQEKKGIEYALNGKNEFEISDIINVIDKL